MIKPLKGVGDFNQQHVTPPITMRRTGDWHGLEMDAPDRIPTGGMKFGLLYFGADRDPVSVITPYQDREFCDDRR